MHAITAVAEATRNMDRRVRMAELYDAHGTRIYRLALRCLRGDRCLAEDLTQDVFVDLIERLDAGAVIDNVGGWLYRATVHRALNRLRRERFLARPAVRWLLGMQMRAPRTPDHVQIERREIRSLFEWINGLPDRQRVVFCMHHLDEMPQCEIADVLGLSRGYVSKLLSRAEARLAEQRAKEVAP